MTFTRPVTFATGGDRLERAAHLRRQSARMIGAETAQLLPFWEGKPLLATGDGWHNLGWIHPTHETLAMASETPVFLGLYGMDDIPVFAADFSGQDRDRLQAQWIARAKFIDLRNVAGELEAADATVAATAKALLGWHATHPFCARCGGPSAMEDGGWRRRCERCGGLHFPRIDPVVIMLVVREGRVLLGRQEGFPEGMYSLLAGYMEPGESLEDAVRRETLEEANIRVGRVAYLACQPWPFPSSLMLGCAAEAIDETITIDTDELEDAFWLPKSDLPDLLAGMHPRLTAPRLSAIARVLLAAWAAGEIEGFG